MQGSQPILSKNKMVISWPLVLAWFKRPFHLLDSGKNRISLILFCGSFSFFFIYTFAPFNIYTWYEQNSLTVFTLSAFCLCSMFAMALSHFLLKQLINRKKLYNYTYLLWFIGDFLLVAFIVFVIDVYMYDYLFFTWNEFIETLKHSSLILALPYGISLLWFYTLEKSRRLKELEQKAHFAIEEKESIPLLHIRDEQGKYVLTLNPEHLLLIRSEDNYVHIFYTTGGQVKKLLVRNTLKRLEAQVASCGFVRTHRSYIINKSKIILFSKNAKGHYLHIGGLDGQTIPVSSSYLPSLVKQLNHTP